MPPSRILVVEDESFVRALIVDKLSEAGFDVDEANNSDVAVRLMDTDGYKLLVTNTRVPGKLDGIELAERKGHAGARRPVLFVTARHGVLERLRTAGVPAAALPRPFALDDIVDIVARLIAPAKTGKPT